MGLQSAMTTALTGLQAAETSIDVIGNNIANSNTVGFKASEVIFATQFLQTQSIGSAPSDTNGGTNPRQVGLGVKVASISPDFSQGTIEISSNSLDLAIQGDGFLVVQGGQGQALFTRNGQLTLNSANQVVTSTGNKLLGYAVNDRYELQTSRPVPIEIPLGGERVAQATSTATFQGVLNPSVIPGVVPGIVKSEVLLNGALGRPEGTNFTTADLTTRSAPPAGVATTTDTGADTPLDPGVYKYRVTFVDVNGQESSASTEFEVTAGPNDVISLSNLPTADPAVWPQMAIYRTESGGSVFHLVTTQAIATSTYIDSVSDATVLSGRELDSRAINQGSYSYYFTYYNSSNQVDETRPSSILGSYAVNDNTSSVRINLSDLPLPTDPNFNKIRIYRNASGDSSNFYLVDEVDAPGQGAFPGSYVDKTLSSVLLAPGVEKLDFDGRGSARAGEATALVDLLVRNSSGYENIFEEGRLTFSGESGGATLKTQELTVTATTTVQELIDFMRDSLGLHDQLNDLDPGLGQEFATGGGRIALVDGSLVVTSNYGEQNEVSIPLAAFRLTPAGEQVSDSVDIRFTETQQANGPGTTTEFLVYDSLGTPLTVRITTVLEEAGNNSTTYRWYAASGDSQPSDGISTVVGNGVMVFDSRGDLVSAPGARISVQREQSAGESPLEIDLDLTQVTSLADTNSSGEPISSFNMTRQDGFPPGVLTDFIITESGLIQGQFSNGTQRTLGQVIMARFANNQGLRQLGDSLYATSVNSGEPVFATPGEDGLGSLTAGAIELSNTDIGNDLVEMILAQTQYQAGSRVISTAQELLDELLALQR